MSQSNKLSYDPTEADLYVVKIWYEVEPEYDAPNGPQAAEEVFFIVANSPDAAMEQAKMQWTGPIDRIKIVDVNPEESEYEDMPFEACNDITASYDPYAIGGHFKMFLKNMAKRDVQQGTVCEWIDEFERITKEAGFYPDSEDWDDDYYDNAFEFYISQVEGVNSKTCVEADDFLSDEDKEILRKADTSDWADMQHERTENAIRKAGGYANWIKKEKDSRKKNNVSCASGISDKAYIRGLLADYLDDGTLSKKQYDDALNVRYDIAGDDLSIIIEAGYLDAVDQLKSIRYMTEGAIDVFNEDNDTQYDGAYVFRYKDGTIEYYGFFAGDDDLYFMGSKE